MCGEDVAGESVVLKVHVKVTAKSSEKTVNTVEYVGLGKIHTS